MIKFLKFSILLILSISFSACQYLGNIFQTIEKDINNNKTVKVIARHEIDVMIPGAYYFFEVVDKSSRKRKEVFSFRHDDPIDIPVNNLVIKNDRLAYFWIGWKCAVTSDGGETWMAWNAEEKDGFDINYGLIENVEIHPDGKGQMTFNDLAVERGTVSFLVTKDFGKTWENN